MDLKELIKEEINYQLDESELIDNTIDNNLEQFEYKDFVVRRYDNEIFLVKSYKFRPNLDEFIQFCDKNFDDYEIRDEVIYDEIETFYYCMRDKLKSKYDVELVAVGRMGGWWGISINDVRKLVEVNISEIDNYIEDNFSDYLTEYFYNLDDDVSDVNINDIVEYISERIIDYMLEYPYEFIDFSKLYMVLDDIDNSVIETEKELNAFLINNYDDVLEYYVREAS